MFYVTLLTSSGKKIKGYIFDISYSGLGILAKAAIKKTETVDIYIEGLKKTGPIKAKIAYSRKTNNYGYNYKLGMRFVTLSKKKGALLAKFFAYESGIKRIQALLKPSSKKKNK